MAKVIYQGRAHVRELSAADLKKHGVEGFSKTSFPRREAVEVEEAVAKVLLEKPKVFGKFELAADDAQPELEGVDEVAPSGSDSTTDSTPRTRSNGASTRTR